jgi:hypothetical protein
VPITDVEFYLIDWTVCVSFLFIQIFSHYNLQGTGTWTNFVYQEYDELWIANPSNGLQFPLFICMHTGDGQVLVDEIEFFTYNIVIGNVQFTLE